MVLRKKRRVGLLDTDRELTEKGHKQFMSVVDQLGRLGLRFDQVCHSPWVRAVQTAELLDPLNDGVRICVDGLARFPQVSLFSALRGETVACVGHEPWMSAAVALLTAGVSDGQWLRFKKGSVAWLHGEPGAGMMALCGFWTPQVLLRLK